MSLIESQPIWWLRPLPDQASVAESAFDEHGSWLAPLHDVPSPINRGIESTRRYASIMPRILCANTGAPAFCTVNARSPVQNRQPRPAGSVPGSYSLQHDRRLHPVAGVSAQPAVGSR